MEALRPRITSTVDRSFTSEKFTIGLVRVIELFRGVKVPSNEPVAKTQSHPPATNAPEKAAQPLSINGHRALPLGKAVYALPSMVVPDEHTQVWEDVIRERLIDELQLHFRSQICQPEFLMVSDSSSKIGPCIILSVWDESLCNTEEGRKKTVKSANKIVRKLQTMQQCHFPFKVIADKISLAARSTGSGRYYVACLEGSLQERRSLVGLELSTGPEDGVSFRLGGLIRVGSEIYGLTVAHPFIRQQRRDSQPVTTGSGFHDLYESDSTDSDCEGRKLFCSQHPTFTGEVTMVGQDAAHTFQGEVEPNARRSIQPESKRAVTLAHSSSSNTSATLFGEVAAQSNWSSKDQSDIAGDWVLIKLNDDVPVLPNLYMANQGGNMVRIDDISTNGLHPRTEVTIVASSGHSLHGVLGQTNVQISVDGLNLTVTQIILQRPLAPGYSGSWVIKDELFVGCLVAVRSFLPVAYMVPAPSIIQEIGKCLNSTDVGLDISNATADAEPGPSQPTRRQGTGSDASVVTETVQHFPRVDLDSVEIPRGPQEAPFERHVGLHTSNEAEPTLSDWPPASRDTGLGHSRLSTISQLLSITGRSHSERTPHRTKELEPGVNEHSRLLSATEEGARRWVLPNPGSGSEDGLDDAYRTSWRLLRYITATYPPSFLAFLATLMPAAILDDISTSLANDSELRSQMTLSIYILAQVFGVLIATPLTSIYGQWRPSLVFVSVSAVFNLASGFSKTSTQLIWFRLLSGIGASGSAALLNAPITVGTIRQRKQLGWLYATSLPLALGLGPLFGAWVTQRLSWTWSFRILAAMSLAALLLVAVFGRNSDHTDDPVKGADDGLQKQQRWSLVRHMASSFTTKLQMLGDPIVALLTIWRAVYFGTLYFIFSSFARLLQDKYTLSHAVSGAWYLALAGGLVLGRVLARSSPIWERDRIGSKYDDGPVERWLVMSAPSSLLVLTGLTLYGWCAEKHNALALPLVGLVMFTIGHSTTPDFAARYVVDVYKMKTLPILSAMNIVMDLAGFGYPLLAPALVRRCGYGWSSTILALSASSVHLGVVIFLRLFGHRLRMRSKHLDDGWVSKPQAGTTPAVQVVDDVDEDDDGDDDGDDDDDGSCVGL